MKKYIKPELDCNEIAMACIMAASSNGSAVAPTMNSGESADPSIKVDAKRVISNSGNRFEF